MRSTPCARMASATRSPPCPSIRSVISGDSALRRARTANQQRAVLPRPPARGTFEQHETSRDPVRHPCAGRLLVEGQAQREWDVVTFRECLGRSYIIRTTELWSEGKGVKHICCARRFGVHTIR